MENKQNLFNAWYELARTMTPETLGALGKTLRNSVQDSEDLIHATVAVMDAAAYAMVKDLEVGSEFMYLLSVLAYRHINNMGDGYTAILNYDDMLDPSKRQTFEKVMPEHVFADLQEKAHAMLSCGEQLHPAQQKHLENIVKGRVPFGYTIAEEDIVTNPNNYELRQPEPEPEPEPEEEVEEIQQEENEVVEDGTMLDNMMVEVPEEPDVEYENEDIEEYDYEDEYDYEPMEPEYVEDEYDEDVMSEQPIDDIDDIDDENDPDVEYFADEIEEKVNSKRVVVKKRREPVEEVNIEFEQPVNEEREEGDLTLAEALSKLQNTRYFLDRE